MTLVFYKVCLSVCVFARVLCVISLSVFCVCIVPVFFMCVFMCIVCDLYVFACGYCVCSVCLHTCCACSVHLYVLCVCLLVPLPGGKNYKALLLNQKHSRMQSKCSEAAAKLVAFLVPFHCVNTPFTKTKWNHGLANWSSMFSAAVCRVPAGEVLQPWLMSGLAREVAPSDPTPAYGFPTSH